MRICDRLALILAAEFPKDPSQDMVEIFTAPVLGEAVSVLLSREQGNVFKPRVIAMVFCCNDCFDSDKRTKNTQGCLSCAIGAPSAGIQMAQGIQLVLSEDAEKIRNLMWSWCRIQGHRITEY